jgi:hypothetical protein
MPSPLKTKPPAITIARMIELYVDERKSLFDISLAAGIAAETVKDHLVRNGIEIRPRGGLRGRTNSKYYKWT